MRGVLVFCIVIPRLIFSQLSTFISDWEKDPDLKNALTSFCVTDCKSNTVLFEHNSHSFVIPASTLKIITTAAALEILEPSFKFKTIIGYTGSFDKQTGVLNGDIIIKGAGDPTLQSESFYFKDTLVTKWANAIKAFGVKSINGHIIGDASNWERYVPDNWVWGDINNYFGAVPNGLSFMDNKFKIVLKSGAVGTKVEFIKALPELLNSKITINTNVVAKGTQDEAYVYGDPFGYTKTISGKIPPNKSYFDIEAAQPDPAILCAETLLQELKKMGVVCLKSKAMSKYDQLENELTITTIYTHASPSLEKIVQVTNITSNNLFAESLLKTIGSGNTQKGIEEVRKYILKLKLDPKELYMTDGSGLSRANLITTSLQANILSRVSQSGTTYKAFYNSLPIAGKQGSMSHIGDGTYIDGKMRAKTGYINKARGYCGYVTTKTGKELAFSILFNNYLCSPTEAKLKIEKFLVALGEI